MTKEDIIAMADKQGLVDYFDLDGDSVGQLMLYTLVFDCIAAERKECAEHYLGIMRNAVKLEIEACAKVCEGRIGGAV